MILESVENGLPVLFVAINYRLNSKSARAYDLLD